MPDKEQDKEHSKISMRIGDVHVEFEGTSENIKKLMDKEMFDLAKKLEATAKQAPPSPETTPKATPKEKIVPPPTKPSTTSGTPEKKSRFTVGKKTAKPGKKGTNWRNVATAMMIVCIVLLASVVGVIAFYVPTVDTLNAQVAEKDISIADLNENVTSLTTQISDLQASLNQLNRTLDNYRDATDALNAQIEYYLSVIFMNESRYLVTTTTFNLNANESGTISQYQLEYAGYVAVSVESSSNTTYVQLLYTYQGVNYDQNVTVAESGTAYFPVLPAGVTIKLGNTDVYTSDSINGTVTIRYYY